jgi:Co/Zn/Cd efflux system component
MTKRFVAIFGLVMLLVGIWLLAHGHAQELVCNANPLTIGASASGLMCPRVVASYLIGAALASGGVILVCLSGVALVRQNLARRFYEDAPALSIQQQYVIGTSLGSDRPVTTSP